MIARERKELSVGNTREQAIERLDDKHTAKFIDGKLEVVFDPGLCLWSVYHRRRPTDKTINRPVTRVARAPYSNGYGKDRRPVVVTLHPREMIETRLKGRRIRHIISWDDLHAYLVRRDALAAVRARKAARDARRKARREQKRKR